MDPSAALKLTRSSRSMIGADQKAKGASVAGSMDPWTSKTPEKAMQLRGRNRGVALSVVAKGLQDTDAVVRSAKRQLLSSSDGEVMSVDVDKSRSSQQLPERYEMLCETFHSLNCVVRLMRMKGVTPAFSNVCRKVEQLTDRRFTYEQLAQMKFILPEVIMFKKNSVLDEVTSCMKNDIHISLDFDGIKADGMVKGGSGRLQLDKIFRSRLLDFYRSHSEETEIPEGPLPEPFAKPSGAIPLTTIDPRYSSVTAEPAADRKVDDKIKASHISPSFGRRFSQKMRSYEEAMSDLSVARQISELAAARPRLSRCTSEQDMDARASLPQLECSTEAPHCDLVAVISARCPSSISQQATTASIDNNLSKEKTPSKIGHLPATLMTATPAPLTPKRSLSPDEENSSKTTNKLVRRAVRARSLKFDTPMKDNVEDECNTLNQTSCSSIDSELADTLDEDLLLSIMEKERKAREDSDPTISQAKRRRDMIAGLPKLFNMVHFYFRSIKRSVITKEELMHNMIASHSNFQDKKEIEEQLELLQELAPEYISESIALSGDNLIRVNKASDAEFIRARLAEAK